MWGCLCGKLAPVLALEPRLLYSSGWWRGGSSAARWPAARLPGGEMTGNRFEDTKRWVS